MTEPTITIVKNPITEKYTLDLQHWDTNEIVDGYTKEEAEYLVVKLQTAIHDLVKCWDSDNHDILFEKVRDEEEARTR